VGNGGGRDVQACFDCCMIRKGERRYAIDKHANQKLAERRGVVGLEGLGVCRRPGTQGNHVEVESREGLRDFPDLAQERTNNYMGIGGATGGMGVSPWLGVGRGDGLTNVRLSNRDRGMRKTAKAGERRGKIL